MLSVSKDNPVKSDVFFFFFYMEQFIEPLDILFLNHMLMLAK